MCHYDKNGSANIYYDDDNPYNYHPVAMIHSLNTLCKWSGSLYNPSVHDS